MLNLPIHLKFYGCLCRGRLAFFLFLINHPETEKPEIPLPCLHCLLDEQFKGRLCALILEALMLKLFKGLEYVLDNWVLALHINAEFLSLVHDICPAGKVRD